MKNILFTLTIFSLFAFGGCTNTPVELNNQSNEIEEKQEVEISIENNNVEEINNEAVVEEKNNDIVEKVEEKVEEKVIKNVEIEEAKEIEQEIQEVLEVLNQDVIIPEANDDGITVLKFKNTNSDEAISALNGKKVSITGYLSTLSPLNGKFAYLMNMPYQNCPYCVPGTSAITNTLTIVAKENEKIKFTDQPVTVTGTLETGTFTDEFGYEYGVRLNNVVVNNADIDELSENIRKYNLLAENGVVKSIYNSIMLADRSVFYNYYKKETPALIKIERIETTKTLLEGYNSNNDYESLSKVINNLITLSKSVNKDIESQDYSNFATYQKKLRSIYSSFARWMAEGEL